MDYPLLDLRLFRFPLFRTSVIGGSLFRLGVGATPFLFPLMLQLNFGLTPFQSGTLIFIGAVGALAAKFIASRMFVRFGFRTLLTACSVVTGVTIITQGMFLPTTPWSVMMTVLVVNGLGMSTFFTGINAFGVADITDKDAGQATAITTVIGQVLLALGVAVGGGSLDISASLHANGLLHADFQNALFVVGFLTLMAAVPFFRLPSDAGSAISGHRLAEAMEAH